jgi:hypothetical protein
MKYEMRTRIILFILHASFFFFVISSPREVSAQSVSKHNSAEKEWELNSPAKYYRVISLGSVSVDSVNKFPHPTATIHVFDMQHTTIRVRFSELGLLGIKEDTVSVPASRIGDTLCTYISPDPLYMLTFPKTQYYLFIDVWSKDGKKILDSRPFECDINAETYKSLHLSFDHPPTTGMGSPTLRRLFQPTLLPLSIETNPGWSATETLNSSMTYSLVFHDPTESGKLEMSLSMHPASIGIVDSAMWMKFKIKAETAFGSRGLPTSSIGDFVVTDTATRRIVKAGYEFVSKNADSSLDYVAVFLTPRAIMMLLAPIDQPNQQLLVQYFQAIARSMKAEP